MTCSDSNDPRPNLRYPIMYGDTEIWPESQWQWSKERTDEALSKNELVFSESNDGCTINFKQYLKNEDGSERTSKPFSIIEGIYTQHGTREIKNLFGDGKTFSFPKPSTLIRELQKIFFDNNYLVLDFFAGSCATAEAVLRLNAEDNGKRKLIVIQLPEPCDEDTVANKAGMATIAEIGKERIRRVATKIKEENPEYEGDLGFKVFKLDASNIKPWDTDFENFSADTLFDAKENIKPDRTEADILYELLLKYGLDLTVPIEEREIEGKTVYIIGAGALIVCLAKDITLDVVEGIATLKDELKPEVMRVVFKDSGFADDVVKTNTVQILRQAGIADVKSL